MSVGLGLPIGDPAQLLSWARRAEATPFTTVALLDRLVFGNPEPLITLAALAGATSRIRLQTEVLLAPLHRTALLAKQAATLDLLSGSRFTLGIGTGGRDDDYLAAGVDLRTRGRRLDRLLAPVNVALGPEPTLDRAREELRAYYRPSSHTDHVVQGLLTTGPQIREAVAAFRAIGADEVMLYCWSPDPDQVERLAGAVFPLP
ncbi:LLM class flavin-dependent oxidoreductase [Streptomyces lydicus]